MNTANKIMALADALSDADFELAHIQSYGGDASKAAEEARGAEVALREAIEALVRDAERLDYLQKNARCDPKMDGKNVWWPTTFNQAQKLKGATLREAIDAAMQEKQS